MSLAYKAVIGAIWTIGSSVGGRLVGLVGTLVLTRYLAPNEYGEVSIAAVVVLTASIFSSLGLGQYVVANPKAGKDAVFHATVYHVATGLLAFGGLLLLGDHLGPLFNAPHLALYIPGLVLAGMFERVFYIPGRVLARDMRFNVLGMRLFFGEITYAGVSVYLAHRGHGAYSVVWGSIARNLVGMAIICGAASWRDWLTPHRLRWATTRKLLDFGLPMTAAGTLHWIAMRGDNLIIAGMFGPATVGKYNLAYNLADIPATQVGEHIGDVLLPSFAKMDNDAWRKKALVRAAGLLSLVVFPLAVGLGAIAHSVVQAIFDPRWYGVAPMLVLLSVLSVVRPVGWLVASYLQAMQRTRTLLVLEVIKTAGIVVCIPLLGQLGVLWACGAIGLAYGAHAFASLWVIHRADGLPLFALVKPLIAPLLACGPMVAGVLLARPLLQDQVGHWPQVCIELLIGGAAYIVSALVVARSHSREFIDLAKLAIRRRRGKAEEAE